MRPPSSPVLFLPTALVLWVAGGAGCTPQTPAIQRPGREPGPAEPIQTVIARVQRNADAMDFLLRAGGVSARGELRRGDRRESFQLHGTLLYRRPKLLYLKLEHVGGTVEAGSNEEEFWFWEKFQTPKYSWGQHDRLDADFEPDVPLRPDLLADILGLGDLSAGTGGPVLRVRPDSYELIFLEHDAAGRLSIRKSLDIDRFEPHLVRSLVYYSRTGQPVVQASLNDYSPVTGSEVQAPRHIRIDWLPDRGYLELTSATMQRFESPAAERRFQSPRQQGLDLGEVRRLDEAAGSAPAAASPPVADPVPSAEP